VTETAAVAYFEPGPPDVLQDVELDVPDPTGEDLLVEVRAISVNPVDVKARAAEDPGGQPKVLGYDAAGVVAATGSDASRFRAGDEVFYAGSIGRPGTYAHHHLVNESIVGHKPKSVDFADAAALPLTSITAWESLFDRFGLTRNATGTILIMGAAGGVGSMVTQFSRRLTALEIVGTAARGESAEWATSLGVHHVVDHHQLLDEVRAVAQDGLDYIFSPFSAGNIENYAELLRPRGQIVAIDEPEHLDLLALKPKSITWHWEFMFTRPLFEPDDHYQHDLLEQVAALVDAGEIRSTRTQTLDGINAETLREAHREIEKSASIGKLVIAA
jgi:NADPH2:quinone reductase